jgi:hypothetical protein
LSDLHAQIKGREGITRLELLSLFEYTWGVREDTFQTYLDTLVRAGLVNKTNSLYDNTTGKWSPVIYKSNK